MITIMINDLIITHLHIDTTLHKIRHINTTLQISSNQFLTNWDGVDYLVWIKSIFFYLKDNQSMLTGNLDVGI